MDDIRFASDVRMPQAASGTGRRRTLNFDITTASQKFQIRDPASAAGECFFTIQHQIEEGVHWHGGPDTEDVPLPDATVDDWALAENTERSYKLQAGETHIAVIGGGTGKLQVHISSD